MPTRAADVPTQGFPCDSNRPKYDVLTVPRQWRVRGGSDRAAESFGFDEQESRRVRGYLTNVVVAAALGGAGAVCNESGGPRLRAGLLALDLASGPGARRIQCIDASASMVALAARRLSQLPGCRCRSATWLRCPMRMRASMWPCALRCMNMCLT